MRRAKRGVLYPTAVMHPVDTVKVRKQALGAKKLEATQAGFLVSEVAETSAVAVASAAAVAGMLAVDVAVAAAAEEEGGSFNSFDDDYTAPSAFDDSVVVPASLGLVLDEAPAVAVASMGKQYGATATMEKTDTKVAATGRGDATVRRASTASLAAMSASVSASPSVSASATFESLDFDDTVEGEMPGAAALGALALTAAEPDEIFAPLGIPLTPSGLLSLYDGLLPNLVKEGPPLALYLGIYEALKAALLQTDLRWGEGESVSNDAEDGVHPVWFES